MNIHISKGNMKVGRIPNISLRPILDCGNCSACKDKCYAMKAYRQYPNVRKAWDENSETFRKDPWEASNLIMDYLLEKKPKYFRIHVAGDFLNQEHLEAWSLVCDASPYINFTANTKMFNLDYSIIPMNMYLRFSMWPGMDIPDSPLSKAWLNDGTDTRIPETAIKCMGNCDKCLVCYTTNKDVVFDLH